MKQNKTKITTETDGSRCLLTLSNAIQQEFGVVLSDEELHEAQQALTGYFSTALDILIPAIRAHYQKTLDGATDRLLTTQSLRPKPTITRVKSIIPKVAPNKTGHTALSALTSIRKGKR